MANPNLHDSLAMIMQAEDAKKEFEHVFSMRNNPTDTVEHRTKTASVVDVIVESNLAASKSEARRLISQGGVSLDNERVININAKLEKTGEYVLKVGKRKFCKVIYGCR